MDRLKEAEAIKADKESKKGKGKKKLVKPIEQTKKVVKAGIQDLNNKGKKSKSEVVAIKDYTEGRTASSSSDIEENFDSPDQVDYIKPNTENITPGKYVLIKLLGGVRNSVNYKYVCCIKYVRNDDDDDEELDNPIVVVSLKRADKYATSFYIVENDVFDINIDQILGILPEPKIVIKDRKIMYVFPGTVSVFEKLQK